MICSTGQIFALKESVIDAGSGTDNKYVEMLQAELEICSELAHPNIVRCLGHSYEGAQLSIFLEYVPGGSMAGVLRDFGALTGQQLQRSTRDCLHGLEYLHSRDPPVVHRDVKGANLLVTLDMRVKLADFGCSKRAQNTQSFTTTGSVPWMAPEVIMNAGGHGRKADIWSLGCTVIEMATAESPWGKDAFSNVMYAMRHIGMTDALPPMPDSLSPAANSFISLCLRRSVDARATALELLGHSFAAQGAE